MKTQITLILLGISLIFSALTSLSQTRQLGFMAKRINCLEMGYRYAGDELCSKF